MRVEVPSSRERGVALLIALLTAVLLAGMAAALVAVSTTETLISAAHRHAEEASHAADAALERALHDLAVVADWSLALLPAPAGITATFNDGEATPVAPDGRRLDLARLGAERQADSDRRYGPAAFGADSPQWRLFAHAPLGRMLPPDLAAPPAYLLVWVADDGGDGDSDPSSDGNGRILVFAEAYGAGGARRAIEAGIRRASNGSVEVVTWREVR